MTDWFLGPYGVKLADWLHQRGLAVPAIVLLIALLAVLFPGPRARVSDWLGHAREKLGLAPTPEERAQLQQIKERRLEPKSSKKNRRS